MELFLINLEQSYNQIMSDLWNRLISNEQLSMLLLIILALLFSGVILFSIIGIVVKIYRVKSYLKKMGEKHKWIFNKSLENGSALYSWINRYICSIIGLGTSRLYNHIKGEYKGYNFDILSYEDHKTYQHGNHRKTSTYYYTLLRIPLKNNIPGEKICRNLSNRVLDKASKKFFPPVIPLETKTGFAVSRKDAIINSPFNDKILPVLLKPGHWIFFEYNHICFIQPGIVSSIFERHFKSIITCLKSCQIH